MAADLGKPRERRARLARKPPSVRRRKRARGREEHGKAGGVAGARDRSRRRARRAPRGRLAPALELRRHGARRRAPRRRRAASRSRRPACRQDGPGRSMKGSRAITLGRLGAGEPAPPGARRGALVEPEDAEIAARSGHRLDHRRGARVGDVGDREAEMEAGGIAHRGVARRDVRVDGDTAPGRR